MKRFTRVLFLALAILTALSTCVSAYDLTTFRDYDASHWANTALSDAVDNKLIGGYEDNTIRADRELTRAEMATVVNRAFGAKVEAPVGHLSDLKNTDWFYHEAAKAVQMQTFGGTGSGFEGNRAIYREEAMAVIARAMVLKDGDLSVLQKYSDYDEVSSWAVGSISALVAKGYVNGTNMNLIEPRSHITRAQFAQIMYNIFSDYIQTSGTYSTNAERSLMINVPDVTLENCTVKGDLVLGDGVGQGFVKLSNVKVTGRILIRGGDKVTLKNVTTGEGIVVKNVNGTVNFQNYKTETVFKNIIAYTNVTYLQRTPYVPSDPSTTYYTVTWKNWDGTTLETDTGLSYGTTPTYNGATPTKDADAQFTYTFDGWSPDVSSVTGDVTYTAKFTETLNKYTVIWTNWDNSVLETDTDVPYGTTPTYNGDTPTRTGGADVTYTFKEWTPAISPVTGNITYKADFTSSDNKYTVTWKNWDGTTLETDTDVPYGTTPSYDGDTPTRDADAQFTYTFAGWTPDTSSVTGDVTYTAKFTETLNKYTVTWKNWDGTTLETDTDVPYGTTPSYDGDTPARDADAEFTYTFAGWTPDTSSVTGDVTYTAKFTETLNKYTVTWKNWDGTTLETDTDVPYGATPSYDDATPTRDADAQFTYTFDGWSPDVSSVTGDVTYTAKFTETLNKYTVTWTNWDNSVLETDTDVPYGTTPTYDGDTPTRTGGADVTYTFKEWTPAVSPVTGNITYKADFTSSDNKYTVTWKNWDGTTLETDTDVPYGATPSYDDATPTRDADNEYTYTFAGWTPDTSSVTGDVTYTAMFTETDRIYTITLVYGDIVGNNPPVSEIEVKWNDTLADKLPTTGFVSSGKKFGGWYNGSELIDTEKYSDIAPSLELTVKWITLYIVRFHDGNNTVVHYEMVEEGQSATPPSEPPTKNPTNEWEYVFKKWITDYTNVQSNLDVYAEFEAIDRIYTITLVYGDGTTGTTPATINVKWNDTLSDKLPDENDIQNGNKVFGGWYLGDEKIDTEKYSNISPATELTVKWIEKFTVTFYNKGGSVLKTEEVAPFGSAVAPADPTFPATKTERYIFAGWDKDFSYITADTDVYAVYNTEQIYYKVSFDFKNEDYQNYDDDVQYGDTVEVDTPSKPGFIFGGWQISGEATIVAGDSFIFNYEEDKTLTAIWGDTYTVVFENGDGSVMKTEYVVPGGSAVAPGETPTKAEDDEFTYTFKEWDKTFTNVTGNLTVKPIFDKTYKLYPITLIYGDGTTGTMPATVDVKWNDVLVDVLPDGSEFSNGTKDFDGWLDGDKLITTEKYADLTSKTLVAKWTNVYTVIFYDADDQEIKRESVREGESATAPTATPEKAEDNEYTYDFAGWDTEFTSVTSDLEVKPIFDKTDKLYTIILYYGIGTTGTMPATVDVKWNNVLKEILPTTGFENGNKLFGGWYYGTELIDTEKYSDITPDTLTAKWVDKYTVTFYNGDGTVMKTEEVVPGGSATAPGETPEKAEDNEYTYDFAGWDKSFENVQSNLDVKPLFDKTDKIYTINLVYGNGTTGTMPATIEVKWNDVLVDVLPDENDIQNGSKVFGGWYLGDEKIDTEKYSNISPATELTAKWLNTYTVIFEDWDGTELKKQEGVVEGSSAIAPADPERQPTKQYTYSFTGWDKDFSNITNDLTVKALYEETEIRYTITFVTDNGDEIDPITVMYEDIVTVRTDLTKPYSYFKGWKVDVDGTVITADSFEFLYETDITLTAEWGASFFKVEHYIPDGQGGYEYHSTTTHGENVGVEVYAKNYPSDITGYILDEAKTTDFGTVIRDEDNPLTLKAYYAETYTVTFYDKNQGKITSVEVLAGDTVSDFPDYTDEMNGYKTGKNPETGDDYTHEAVSTIYTTEYVHKIYSSWGHKVAGEYEEFTEETRVYSDIDVYPVFKRVTLDLFVKKLEDKAGGEFEFFTFYDESRLVDSVKDILWSNRGRILTALSITGAEDKLLEKLDEKGFITTNREILNQEVRIKLVTLIGDENLDEFVKTEAEKNVSEDNMTSFLRGYIHDEPDEATVLLLDFLHLATQDDIDTIFKPAVKTFLEKDSHLLEEEIKDYINGLTEDEIKELIRKETDFIKSFITNADNFSFIEAHLADNAVYVGYVIPSIMSELNGYAESGNFVKLNGIIDRVYSTDSLYDITSKSQYDTISAEIENALKSSTNKAIVINEVTSELKANTAAGKEKRTQVANIICGDTGLLNEAIDSIYADDDNIVKIMTSDANKGATIDTIMSILFDGSHEDQLDQAVSIVVHDIATSTNPDVLLLVEEFSQDVVIYLEKHPDKRDILVEMVVEELYRDTIDRFTKELREEEKFTVHDNFSSLIAMAMYNKYSVMTIEDFMKEVNLPESFDKVLSNEAIRDIVENIYYKSLNPYLAQLKDAYESFEADLPENKGTYYVDTFVTVKVDPIDELVNPLYDEFRRILDEKASDKHYYKDNPYAVALVDLLSPDILLNKMADGSFDASVSSGYTIPTAEELYTIVYTVAVLADDAGKWYYNELGDKYEGAVDKFEDKILEYANCLIGLINEYYESGEIPNIEDLPDDKLRELLEKYDIQGIVDRTEQIQAIKDKIVANEKFNSVIDKFVNSKFNRPLTGEDYDKAKRVLDIFFYGYVDEEKNVDYVFDNFLSNEKFDDYRESDDKYEVTFKENTATLTRKIFFNE